MIAGPPITVAVPVRGGGDIVTRCFERLLRHTNFAEHHLLVVVDDDPTFATSELAGRLRQTPGATVVERTTRGGFAAAANDAFGWATGDVVLVNSDVLVAAGWLESLAEAASSSPHVATVTPWSNDATVCSFPRAFQANPLPAGFDVDTLAAAIAVSSARLRPRLPTGVGSCLYLRREALEAVGNFDVEAFGLGYGEETDFCLRASARGFLHLLDDATFVFHRGQSSFGFARALQVARAERVMRTRHPGYVATIAAAMRDDPTRQARANALAALETFETSGDSFRSRRPGPTPQPARVFHLVHGFPPWNRAGTEIYCERLVRFQAARREVMVHARVGGSGAPRGASIEQAHPDSSLLLRLVANDFDARNPIVRNAIWDRRMARDVGGCLDRFRPELVHFHHLAGHSPSVVFAAKRRHLPIVFQLQDWWAPCARANLLDAHRQLCPGPGPARCAACLPLTGIAPAGGWSRALYRLRAKVVRRALAAADVIVMGSEAIRTSYQQLGWLPAGIPLEVLDYGTPAVSRAPRVARGTEEPLRLGFVGSLLPHKGAHIAIAAVQGLNASAVELEVWGDPKADPAYTRELTTLAGPVVKFCGRFSEAERDEIFARFDLLLVPSLGLESYGLVVREAFARGIPVLASDRGALPEAFPAAEAGGRVLNAEAIESWREALRQVCADPGLLARWAAAIPPQTSTSSHAEAIEAVYSRVLERRQLAGGPAGAAR